MNRTAIAAGSWVGVGVLCTGVSLFAPAPGQAAPVAASKQAITEVAPLEQTIDGYTLRLTKMSWVTPSVSHDPYVKALRVDYSVKSTESAKKLSNGQIFNDTFNGIRSSRLIGPHGEEASGWGWANAYGMWDVDPRWDKATVEFEFQDPAIPAEIAGPFVDTLEFKDIPVPDKIDEPLEVNRSITTDRGDRFTLLQTRVRVVDQGDGGMVGELAFTLKQENKPNSYMPWGFKSGTEVRVVKVVNDKGEDITATTPNNGDPIYEGDHPDRSVFIVRPLSGHPKKMTLHIQIKQWPERLPRKWYRYFRFNIDPSRLPMPTQDAPAAPENEAPPGKTVEGKMADVTVERQLAWKDNPLTSYIARVWIRDKRKDAVPPLQRDWIFWNLKGRSMRGTTESESKFYVDGTARSMGGRQLFWKADGTPPRADEMGLKIGGFASEEERPKSISYELTLESVHKYLYGLSFKGIPIPKPGQILEPNIVGTTLINASLSSDGFTNTTPTGGITAGARLVLRRISYFPDEAVWKALPIEQRAMMGPGLYAVFILESNSERSDEGVMLGLRCLEVRDDKGREVFQRPGLGGSSGQMLRREQLKDGNRAAFALAPPEPDAKSFDMQVQVNETVPTGEQETFVVPDVPVPQK